MSARPLAKDIIPDEACIGVLGQSLAAAPLGVRGVENLRPVASPDKEQSTEGQHAPVSAAGAGVSGDPVARRPERKSHLPEVA
jgi:hypothetical protein